MSCGIDVLYTCPNLTTTGQMVPNRIFMRIMLIHNVADILIHPGLIRPTAYCTQQIEINLSKTKY